MRNIFKNKPLLIALAAVLLLGLLAMFSAGERTLTVVESAAGGILQPVQAFASRASDAIILFVQNTFNTTEADIENQQLKVTISQLEQKVNEMDNLRAENERLKKLLNYAEQAPDLSYVTGVVTARSPGVWFEQFTLNVGRSHGVDKNMPVISGQGLIGRVTAVGATYCKVVTLLDTSTSVSVMVERTRDTGMVRGLLEAGNELDTLELYYLPADSDLLPGDKIVTSGIGGLYPKGLLVGEVREVSRASSNDRNAIVTPASDLRHLEECMVVVGMPAEAVTP